MKKIFPWLLLAALFACLAVVPVKAGTYYQRVRVEVPGTTYWNGYCWVSTPASYRYEYREATPPVQTKTVYKAPEYKPPVFAPGWKEKALDLAKQRDEYMSYLKTLDVLGFHGQPYGYGMTSWVGQSAATSTYGSYGYGMNQSSYSSQALQLGYFGANGNTTYGYSYNTLKDPYGDLNLNSLYQQAGRLVQNAQTLAGQGNSDFSALVGQAGMNAARVAEILAKAKAAETALNAARADPLKVQSNSGVGTSSTPVPAPTPVERARVFLKEVGVPKCGQCHTPGTGQKGSFSIFAFPSMTADQKAAVMARINATDDKVMPPRTHPPLTDLEKKRFLEQ